MGEELLCERELGNVVDRYDIAVKKLDSGVTVGHLPKKISRVCSMFTQRGGEITATVTGAPTIFVRFSARRIGNSL